MTRVLAILMSGLCVTGCSGSSPSSSPTTPTSTSTTRVIELSGNLAFGNIEVGQTANSTLTIRNSGNSILTVTGMTAPSSGGTIPFASNFTSGTIPAGVSQPVTIRFTPTTATTYSGTLTVNGDHTTGTNTIAISGTGAAAPMLSGVVTAASGAPLIAARVAFLDGANQGKSATTGADGAYQITGLSNGGFTVLATLPGYNELAKPVGISGSTTLHFTLLRPAAPPAPPPAPRVRVGATCNDGTASTATGSGACSGHGGVRCWRYSDGTCTNP